jgi:putative endonuclease
MKNGLGSMSVTPDQPHPKAPGQWWVYLVRCADGTFYTGITTDVSRRVKEHNTGKAGAKYTRARRPVVLVYQEATTNRQTATTREHELKKLPRRAKSALENQVIGGIDKN